MPPWISAVVVPVVGAARRERIEAVTYHSQLRDLLDGWPQFTRYDLDSYLVVDDDGGPRQLEVNQRVTRYVLTDSLAARQQVRTGQRFPDGYCLLGTVVILGADRYSAEPQEDAPARFDAIFGLERLAYADRLPYVGTGPDGCRRSAQIDREEADTFDMLDARREACVVSAYRWEHLAAYLEGAHHAR